MADEFELKTNNEPLEKMTDKESIGVKNPVWLSVSEAAKFGGITTKTVRRAIQSKTIKYKVVRNRYLIDLISVVAFLNSSLKLKNKFNQHGFGQYVAEWRKD